MVYSRSQAAWHLSAQKLFNEYPAIYWWTFTFKEVLPDWYYPFRWQGFVRDLVWNIYGGNIAGLRVIEPHEEHGFHYHALLSKRIWVGLVRQVGRRWGIGRIQVAPHKVDIGCAGYMAKYLDKKHFPTSTRIARWHSVGNFTAVHKNDIEVLSPLNAEIHEAKEAAGDRRLERKDYQRIWLNHFDLCSQSELPPRKITGDSLKKLPLSASESQPSLLGSRDPGSNSSTAKGSPRSPSLANATLLPANCIHGFAQGRTYTLRKTVMPPKDSRKPATPENITPV